MRSPGWVGTGRQRRPLVTMAMAGSGGAVMCLLLGASGAGKTLLVKRLQNIPKLTSKDGAKDLGEPPVTLPTVGTNLTDLSVGKKITVRELGGCMGPIWSSYYSDCCCVLYMIDAAKPTQISSSCVQLMSLLSAEVLNDLPCYMTLVEMKSLFRIPDILACAKQSITVVETSARDGTGLSNVMQWFHSTLHV